MILRNPGVVQRGGRKLWFQGNAVILDEPLHAVLCSRACPGANIIEALDLAQQWRAENRPVISGFHTPVEKECLRIFLRGPQHLVICPARGIDPFQLPADWEMKYQHGELLILSPFPAAIRRAARDIADARNELVFALSANVHIIYASPGGHLETLQMAMQKPTKN
jgi:predicted Rossmann fold nucleotide-binding protein DprA/Smf involved in DNA uptake